LELPPLQIIHYPHPTLRRVSQPVRRVDAQLRAIAAEMLELMYAAQGVGLAANQVDLPLRLFVVNLAGKAGEGEELVFLNPVLRHPKGTSEREEGCLSMPAIYADVKRPERITLQAYDLAGNEVNLQLSGMLARVVQHEVDHLDGVLFIDRLSATGAMTVREGLEELERAFSALAERGEAPGSAELAARWAELEQRYCRRPRQETG